MDKHLINFISTGRFLEIGLNSSMDDVIRAMGIPIHVYDESEHSHIYNYEGIEFIFGKNGVASIEIKMYEDWGNIRGIDISVTERIKLDEFINFLSHAGVSHKIGKPIADELVVSFDENGKASFSNGILRTISFIMPAEIY